MKKNKRGPKMLTKAPQPDADGTVVVPAGIEAIGRMAFSGNPVRRVVLPDSVREIGHSAFMSALRLKEIVLPPGVQSIGEAAFKRTGLRRLVVPAGITKVPAGLFDGCAALEGVVFEGHLTDIGDSAFRGCGSLKHIQFADTPGETGVLRMPESLKTVGKEAFRGCGSLQKVELDSALRCVDVYAFADCTSLEAIYGSSRTKYGYDVAIGCRSSMHLCLPDEVDDSRRGYFGLPDADGFVRDGGRLLTYRGSADIVEIPEGIEVVGENAFARLSRTRPIEIRWPRSLKRIEQNDALFMRNVKSELPVSFIRRGSNISQYELSLMQGPWRASISAETLARFFLTCRAPIADWAGEQAESPEKMAGLILKVLVNKPRKTARVRAAEFFTRYADRISGRLKDRLQSVLAGADAPAAAGRHPYREDILDVLLENYGLDPHHAVFSLERRPADGRGRPKKLPALAMKSALVPYMVQADRISTSDMLLAKAQTRFIPAAESQAGKVDKEILAAVIGLLHAMHSGIPQLAYAYARYAEEDSLRALIDETGAGNWHYMDEKYAGPTRNLVRAGALLNDTSAARELFLSAPKWMGMAQRYRELHPGLTLLLPADPLGLAGGGCDFTVPGASLRISADENFTLEIRDTESRRAWKQMPRKLPIAAQDKKDLGRLLDAGRTFISEVDSQVTEVMFDAYLSGKPVDKDWLQAVCDHPVLRRALGRTVLEQNGSLFVFHGGQAEDADGNAVPLRSFEGIQVAHVLEMDPQAADAWRRTFELRKWTARFGQLEEPRYEAADIRADRFDHLHVSLATITDNESRSFMFTAMALLKDGTPDGNSMHYMQGRYASEFYLGKIHVRKVSRRMNRVLYHLDQLTALNRLRRGDMSVLPFYSLTNNARLNNALRELAGSESTEMMASLLAIQDRRRQAAGTKKRLSSEFSL